MAEEHPSRVMDRWSAEFWNYTEQRELRMQVCSTCGKCRWPPSPLCDNCLSESYAWSQIDGAARLLSWVVFHREYFPEYPPPHLVVAAELDQGAIFIGSMENRHIPELRDGLRLQLLWVESSDKFGQYQLPNFEPSHEDRL
jgi:uncharacterized protein